MGDAIHMKPAEGECEIHDFPDEGLGRTLVDLMRARHGKGGVNVCRDCVTRAKKSVSPYCPEHGNPQQLQAEFIDGEDGRRFFCRVAGCGWERTIPKPENPIVAMMCPHGRRGGYMCPHCIGVS